MDRASAGPLTVLIAGPTASGKSRLALELAKRLDGVVVNADSMQVYSALSILTARPSEAEMAGIPHRLYGHVAPTECYTVARYLEEATAALSDIRAEGRTAIIVGGTGLYFTGLTKGLAPVPEAREDVRADVRSRMGQGVLHQWLAEVDAAMAARLNPADEQRIARALEVKLSTGKSLGEFQRGDHNPQVRQAYRIVIAPPRDWLRERIARRFHLMVEAGGLEEARAFAALQLDPTLPAMKAIGVPEMMAVALGAVPEQDGIARAITSTHQFAKRQETWFRNQFSDWRRLNIEELEEVDTLSQEIAIQRENPA